MAQLANVTFLTSNFRVIYSAFYIRRERVYINLFYSRKPRTERVTLILIKYDVGVYPTSDPIEM